MTHSSPAAYLVLALATCTLFSFVLFHLWSFDHFKCLKWNDGASPGTFKRVMTYSYLLTGPLIATYALGFVVIKYRQGFVEYEGAGEELIPKPYTLWPETDRRFIFPLILAFSLGWSLGIISHLEELCFWLFLMNSTQRNWFNSRYFHIWILGSGIAIIYVPLLTILTRFDPLKVCALWCEAYTFLGGSIGSLLLTVAFIPILWVFPAFLANLQREGVNTKTIVRLTKFHELNIIRTVFRFIFVDPFVILGSDGVRPHKHINESMLWTDFLTIVGAFGCCISSALTLVIFFPRSVEGEIASKDVARRRRTSRLVVQATSKASLVPNFGPVNRPPPAKRQLYSYLPSYDGQFGSSNMSQESPHKEWTSAGYRHVPEPHTPRNTCWAVEPVHCGEVRSISSLVSEGNLYLRRIPANTMINPLVHNFTSPIGRSVNAFSICTS
ncbi:hypothetical protein K438DRAFT_1596383 [Mycena galopus ATCC 62051]|nr:hypothetical protein K438DRAFT_1596383 [Mycena galopus ATCC 62051]